MSLEISFSSFVVAANALSTDIPPLSSLETLDLAGNGIGDEGAISLSQELPSLTSLQMLNLSRNIIGVEGAISLSQTLFSLSLLQTLNLEDNRIEIEGAVALSRALPHLSSFHTLNLAGNDIGDEGAVALSQALPLLSSFHTLNLANNGMGIEGAVALSGALPSLSSLHTLNLARNNIGDEGALHISRVLAVSYFDRVSFDYFKLMRFQREYIRLVKLPDCVLNIIESFLSRGVAVEVLFLGRNGISSQLKEDGDLAEDDFTSWLAQIASLTEINLNGNSLSKIDVRLLNLPGLRCEE